MGPVGGGWSLDRSGTYMGVKPMCRGVACVLGARERGLKAGELGTCLGVA